MFDYAEDSASRRVQASWRARQGRRRFQARLASETVLDVADSCILGGAAHAWVGYRDEGMTLAIWLSRHGLAHLLAPLTKGGGKAGARAAGADTSAVLARLRRAD